jgi:hypothetical protein
MRTKLEKLEYNRNYYYLHKEELSKKRKKYSALYRQNNKEKTKLYYQNNKEELNKKSRERNKKYYQTHKSEINDKHKEYRKTHKKENTKRTVERKKIDVGFKISHNLRSRIFAAIKNGYKSGSAVKDLGCSIPKLKAYLESKFQKGMTWQNWSKTGWHIDHILPLTSFDLTNRKEFLKACHYTNLQPMWAEENIRKGSKYE